MTIPTQAQLELVRLVREHCYQMLIENGGWVLLDSEVVRVAEVALEVPIEEMADWFNMSDTVLANLRLAMTMTEQRFQPA